MGFLSYYSLPKEPNFSIAPLDTSEAIERYFHGREAELQKIHSLQIGAGDYAMLLVGPDGSGKTSLLRKFLLQCQDYIYLAGDDIDDFDQVQTARVETMFKGEKGSAILSDLPPAPPVIRQLVLVLDGQDFLKNFTIDSLAKSCFDLRRKFTVPTILVYSCRDPLTELRDAFLDRRSKISRMFDELTELKPFGIEDSNAVNAILRKRLHLKKDTQLPFNSGALTLLDQFASGNIRELLRFTRTLMTNGFDDREPIPLTETFCTDFLVEQSINEIESDAERTIIKELEEKALTATDLARSKRFGSDRTVRRVLERLEERRFVVRETHKPGVKQPFLLTEKARLFLQRKRDSI